MPKDGNGVGIRSLGACLPKTVRSNAWWIENGFPVTPSGVINESHSRVANDRASPAWRAASRWTDDPFRGAKERRAIDEDHEASDLEVAACTQALEGLQGEPSEVQTLLGYSTVSDDAGLGNHGLVAHRLPSLGQPLSAMTVAASCASFVPQFIHASRLCTDGRSALLFQSSATSRIIDYTDPTSTQLGDAAVAQVVGPVEEGLGFVDGLQLTKGGLREGIVLAATDGRRRWYESGAPESRMVIQARDPRLAVQMGTSGPNYAAEACHALLERNQLTTDDVDFFICAQAGVWFGEACAAVIGIDDRRIVPAEEHFQRFAHTLSASAPLNLWVAWSSGRLKKGDLVLIYIPGAGFTQAAALLRWSMNPPEAPFPFVEL
ncbi:MAG: 3-oxoacyl-[acyl-carrier-protein] synthase III C-terminal domain-containing protein [Myxococcota bacterium]